MQLIQTIEKNTNYRYERKFTARAVHRLTIIARIKNHPALFREIYAPRHVNNIYLDTLGLQFYKDNKIGISERKKVRIRWYGERFGKIEKPKLEYKIKSGQLGTKWVFDLPKMEVKQGFSNHLLFDVFKKSNLPEAIKEDLQILRPSLLNTYRRTYFLSSDGHFRLTFDEQLEYYRIDAFGNRFLERHEEAQHFVLELKYMPEHDGQANNVAEKFPFRMDKSSKYVNGIDAVTSQVIG